MKLDPSDRDADLELLEAAFLAGRWNFFGESLRPISLGSILIARRLGLSVVLTGGYAADLTPEALDRQIMLFVWAHSEPIEDVLEALDAGTWEDAFAGKTFSREGYAASIFLERIRGFDRMAGAALVDVRSKPGRAAEPDDVIEPLAIADKVHKIAGSMHFTEAFILWELPLGRALQYYHCTLRSWLAWTVKPSREARKSLDELEARLAAAGPIDNRDDVDG